jgi:hypothetical protein
MGSLPENAPARGGDLGFDDGIAGFSAADFTASVRGFNGTNW